MSFSSQKAEVGWGILLCFLWGVFQGYVRWTRTVSMRIYIPSLGWAGTMSSGALLGFSFPPLFIEEKVKRISEVG